MESVTVEGWWRVPNLPGEEAPGRLTFDEDGARLDMYSLLRTDADEPAHPLVHRIEGRHLPIVHGRARSGAVVTLLGVDGPVGFAGDIAETYRADIALMGRAVTEADSFTEARLQFDWLDSWLRQPAILTDDLDRDEATLHLGTRTLGTTIVGNDELVFLSSATGRWSDEVVDLARKSTICARLGEPAPWRAILDQHVRPLQDFLTVAIGRPVRLTGMYLRPADGDAHAGLLDARLALIQQSPSAAPSVAKLLGYAAPTLLMGDDIEGLCRDVLPAWYALYPDCAEVITKLTAPFYAPFTYVTGRYAFAVQAAEALHQKVFGGRELGRQAHNARVDVIVSAARSCGVSEADLAWAEAVLRSRNDKSFTQRIAEVISAAGQAGSAITASLPEFARDASSSRVRVSHGGFARQRGASSDATRRYWETELLTWVVRVILLDKVGVPDVDTAASQRALFREAIDRLANLVATGLPTGRPGTAVAAGAPVV